MRTENCPKLLLDRLKCLRNGLKSPFRIGLLLASFFVFAALSVGQTSSSKYLLGPGDRITISLRDLKEIEIKPATIDRDGTIDLQYAGRLKAEGLTTEQLGVEIQKKMAGIIRKPNITVEVTEFGSQPVSILGSVNKPGVHQLRGGKNLVEVLAMAEGMKPEAGNVIKVTRPRPKDATLSANWKEDASGQFVTTEIGVKALLEARTPEANIQIRPHDVISIPRADLVYVMGGVRKPGGFMLAERESITVLQAVSMAEGVAPGSAPQRARILRPSANSSTSQEIVIDVKQILANKAPDQKMQPNDILFIPSSAMKVVSMKAIEAGLQMATGLVIFR